MCYDIEDIEDIRALAAAVRDMTAVSDPAVLIERLCESTVQLTGFSWSALGLVDHADTIRLVSSAGTLSLPDAVVVAWGEGIGGSAVRHHDSYLLDQGRAVDNEDLVVVDPTTSQQLTEQVTTNESFIPVDGVAVAHPVVHGGLVVAVLYAGRAGPGPHEHPPLAIVSELATFAAPLLVSAIRASDLEILAKEEERQRIVRHLHDTSLQLLFNISLSTQRLQRGHLNDPQTRGILDSISADARDASDCLRNTFRANAPSERGLIVALRELTKAFSARTMVPAEVTTLGAPRQCPDEVDRVLFEATREILHNIEKHANASSVMVGLAYRDAELTLLIQDDGVGLPKGFTASAVPHGESGLGLAGVSRAAAAVGGHVDWSSNEDGGATMKLSVPLGDAA